MNKVILIGNVGRDPEMRYTPSGQAVTSFSVATSYGKGDDKATEWFNCSAWGKQAELTNEYLRKGSQVYVEGRIRSREYEVDGKPRTGNVEVKFTGPDGITIDLSEFGWLGQREEDEARDAAKATAKA